MSTISFAEFSLSGIFSKDSWVEEITQSRRVVLFNLPAGVSAVRFFNRRRHMVDGFEFTSEPLNMSRTFYKGRLLTSDGVYRLFPRSNILAPKAKGCAVLCGPPYHLLIRLRRGDGVIDTTTY